MKKKATELAPIDRHDAKVTASAHDENLSLHKAANVLGISHLRVMMFIRSGALVCHHVGTHQLISYVDLMDFKERYEKASRDVAEALAADLYSSRQITLTNEEMAELDDL